MGDGDAGHAEDLGVGTAGPVFFGFAGSSLALILASKLQAPFYASVVHFASTVYLCRYSLHFFTLLVHFNLL